MKAITKEDEIEFIMRRLPESIPYLFKTGVCGTNCGEPVWGSFESVARKRDFSDSEIEGMVSYLNTLLEKKTEKVS